MNTFVWVLQIVLALMFFAAGVMKLMKPKHELQENMSWVEDFKDQHIKGIGAVEVLGALGLILPSWLGIAPILTPLAAVGLAVTMDIAAVVHLRRREFRQIVLNTVLFIGLAIVAWARFGDYAL